MSFKFHFVSADSPIFLELNGVKYREINRNYTKLSIKTIHNILKRKEIKKYFDSNGHFFLQLLPAYIHNYIKISLKIADIVNTNNLEISGSEIINQAIRDNVIMGSIKKYWVGDLDFIINLLKRKLSQNNIKLEKIKTDTLFLTLPKNLKHCSDIEFGEIIKFFKFKKKESIIVQSPYYSDRLSAFSFQKIKDLKKHKKNVIHWDRFENFYAFFSAIYSRISLDKFKFQKLSNDNLENFLFNMIIKWAYKILLPYDFTYILKTAENLLNNISCKNICLTYEHGPYAKLLMNAAQNKDIKCYAFIHGYLLVEKESDYSNIPLPRFKDRYNYKPLKTFVYNGLQKNSLIQNSIYNESDIYTVGNWKISSIYKDKKFKYNFCFFDSYNQISLHELILNVLISLKININEIYYRPHPNQSEEQSKKNWIISGGLEKNILTKKDFTSLEIISKTKLGLFDFSSTIMEAAEIGIEILYTSMFSEFENKNLPTKNHFRNSSELKKKIVKWKRGSSFLFPKTTEKKFNFSENNQALNQIFKEIYPCK